MTQKQRMTQNKIVDPGQSVPMIHRINKRFRKNPFEIIPLNFYDKGKCNNERIPSKERRKLGIDPKRPCKHWLDGNIYPEKYYQDYKGNLSIRRGEYKFHWSDNPMEKATTRYLVTIDLDHPTLYEDYFKDVETYTSQSPFKGFHLLIWSIRDPGTNQSYQLADGREIEIKTKGFEVLPPGGVKEKKIKSYYEEIKDTDLLTVDHPFQFIKECLPAGSIPEPEKPVVGSHGIVIKGRGDNWELTANERNKIVEMLEPAYIEGKRHKIIFSLKGWLKKSGVIEESAIKLVEALADKDDEKQKRVADVRREYQSTMPDEKRLGSSGLSKVLSEVLHDDEVHEIMITVSKILGTSNHPKENVYAEAGVNKWYIADYNNLAVWSAGRDKRNNKFKLGRKITEGVIVDGTVLYNPLDQSRTFQLDILTDLDPTNGRLIHVSGIADEVVGSLKSKTLVNYTREAPDAWTTLLNAYERAGRLKVEVGMDQTGFFLRENQVVFNGEKIQITDLESLKDALIFLNEMGIKAFDFAIERFATVIKWSLTAPFHFYMKQKGFRNLKWVCLFGEPDSGKTTLGTITRYIWDLPEGEYDIGGSSIASQYQIGEKLKHSTFPMIVNEPIGALNDPAVVEIVKRAIRSPVAREKHTNAGHTIIPALTPFLLTSNNLNMDDSALIKRMIVQRYTAGDRRSQKQIEEFENEYESRFPILREIGAAVSIMVCENPDILEDDHNETGIKILNELYKMVDLPVPEWVNYWQAGVSIEDITESKKADIIGMIREDFIRAFGQVKLWIEGDEWDKQAGDLSFNGDQQDPATRWNHQIKGVLEANKIFYIRFEKDFVYIDTGIIKELKKRKGIDESLKGISELFKWPMSNERVYGDMGRRIKVQFDKFVKDTQ